MEKWRNGQATTEYLVILAVILVATLIVVVFMKGLPSFGVATSESQDRAYWSSLSPIAITDYSVTNNSLAIVMKNMTGETITATDIEINGASLGISEVLLAAGSEGVAKANVPECSSGFSYDVAIVYSTQYAAGLKEIGKKPLSGICSDSSIKLSPSEATGYQNEGTLSCDVKSLVLSKNGSYAPGQCGTVTMPYFATGTSGAYFDAIAVKFDVSGYNPAEYSAALKVYIKDGSYSAGWHQYILYPDYQDNSECADSTPQNCTGAVSFNDGYEGWINIEVPESYWQDGDLSLRIWDAAIDSAGLQLIKK